MNNLLITLCIILFIYVLFLLHCIFSIYKSFGEQSRIIRELIFTCEYRSKMIKELLDKLGENK